MNKKNAKNDECYRIKYIVNPSSIQAPLAGLPGVPGLEPVPSVLPLSLGPGPAKREQTQIAETRQCRSDHVLVNKSSVGNETNFAYYIVVFPSFALYVRIRMYDLRKFKFKLIDPLIKSH